MSAEPSWARFSARALTGWAGCHEVAERDFGDHDGRGDGKGLQRSGFRTERQLDADDRESGEPLNRGWQVRAIRR